MGYVIVLVALFGLMWFLLIRPQRRRAAEQLAMQDSISVGEEILTAGGIHGTVKAGARRPAGRRCGRWHGGNRRRRGEARGRERARLVARKLIFPDFSACPIDVHI